MLLARSFFLLSRRTCQLRVVDTIATVVRKVKKEVPSDVYKRKALALLGLDRKDEIKVHKIMNPNAIIPETTPRLYIGVQNSGCLSEFVELCNDSAGQPNAVLQMIALKTVPGSTYFYKVFFKSEELRDLVLKSLENATWKGNKMLVRTTLADYSQLHLKIDTAVSITEIKELCGQFLNRSDSKYIGVTRLKSPTGEVLPDCNVRFTSPDIRDKVFRGLKLKNISVDLVVTPWFN